MVKMGQSRRMVDAVFEWKSRKSGKQEKADVNRRQEIVKGTRECSRKCFMREAKQKVKPVVNFSTEMNVCVILS